MIKTKGAILRSKVKWYEEGERNTRYFYSLENSAQTKKAIDNLKITDKTYIYDQYTKCKYGGPLGWRPARVAWKRG